MPTPEKKRYSGKYDTKLKVIIAREYLTTDQGYKSLSVKYHIPPSSISDIVAWYKQRYPAGVEDEPVTASTELIKLSESDLKITALELLIENASKELGVDIIKKFGTKQLKK